MTPAAHAIAEPTESESVMTETVMQSATPNLLAGQVGLVVGVAHKSSIAWAISQALAGAGMKLAFTYQNERLEKNVRSLTDTLVGEPPLVLPCEVTDDAQIQSVIDGIRAKYGRLDHIVHSVAFAQKEDLEGRFVDTSRDGFLLAMNISAYSLTAVAKAAEPLMAANGGGSITTLTYLGGERVVQNYNVMGVAKAALEMSVGYLASDLGAQNIRVNAISAGPIKTLAARGISGFSNILDQMQQRTPLRRNVDQHEVADTALFLASPLSRGITGEVIHVDAGFHVIGF
jgi:enoyl-[acyl-carrier protein] reductase I